MDHGITGWNESVPQTDIPVEDVNQCDFQLVKLEDLKKTTTTKKQTLIARCCRFQPVVVGLSGCGDEAGGCDEGKVATGFRVTLPALLAGTKPK